MRRCTAWIQSRLSANSSWALAILAAAWACSAAAGSLRFEMLRSRIIDHNVRSIEELLPLLPPDYRSRYALMFSSRSLQAATYKDPRVILYGDDARFVLTFNGDPREKGFETLETMEFDEQAEDFLFREIVFPGQSPGIVTFSDVNPVKCSQCHGTPAKPVWDTFPAWPGAYGERYRAHLSAEENRGLQSFLDAQPTHPRYRFLTRTTSLASREAFYPSAKTKYEGGEAEPPNSELTTLLSKLNFQRIARELAGSPRFAAYRYVLLAAVSPGCGDIREFFPDKLKASFESSYAGFSRAADRANREQARTKRQRELPYGDREAPAATFADDGSVNKFLAIVEAGLGLQTQHWSLALERETYDFRTSRSFMAGLAPLLLKQVASSDPAIQDLGFYRTFTSDDKYCSVLRRRSRLALGAATFGSAAQAGAEERARAALGEGSAADRPPAPQADTRGEDSVAREARAIPRPPLLKRCVACHTSGAAPYLPFAEPAQLARELRAARYPRGTLMDEIRFRLSPQAGPGRMPVDMNAGSAERAEIAAYFEAVFRVDPKAADPAQEAPQAAP